MDEVSNALQEGYKSMADTAKHLTTLCTASVVILATYLKDVFDRSGDPREVDWMIPVIFTGFSISLLLAVFVAYFVPLRLITPAYKRSVENPGSFIKALYRFQDAEYGLSIMVFWCYRLSLVSFALGVILLAGFAWKNLD